jgi:hypothetical protein
VRGRETISADVHHRQEKIKQIIKLLPALIFGQMSKRQGNHLWQLAVPAFFQQGYPLFQWIVSKSCAVAPVIDDLLTPRRTANLLKGANTNRLRNSQTSSMYLFGGTRLICS